MKTTKNDYAKALPSRLPDLFDSAASGEPAPGLGKSSILYMAPNFDEPMEEFRESIE